MRMKSQPSPWVMVASVMPWKRCEPGMTRLKNSCGLARTMLRLVASHEKIEPVDLLPHFARNLFARRPRILPRERETGENRVRIFLLQGQELGDRAFVRGFVERIEKIGLFERSDDRRPMLHRVGLASEIEEELEIHIEEPGVIFRPLDVAAHPIKRIGNAAEHCVRPGLGLGLRLRRIAIGASSSSSTIQVSLLPPPCEELTTSEPRSELLSLGRRE